jgi:hypothetical protein
MNRTTHIRPLPMGFAARGIGAFVDGEGVPSQVVATQ